VTPPRGHTCRRCGVGVEAGSQFCAVCGEPIASEPSAFETIRGMLAGIVAGPTITFALGFLGDYIGLNILGYKSPLFVPLLAFQIVLVALALAFGVLAARRGRRGLASFLLTAGFAAALPAAACDSFSM
jgi:hypothetical protein